METNKFSPKDESKEKLILLEALLSKSIISFMWFFSTNNIAENVDLDKKTINSHKATGIPPKYFGLYVEALGKCSRPSLEMQEILKSKPHAAESCKILTQMRHFLKSDHAIIWLNIAVDNSHIVNTF